MKVRWDPRQQRFPALKGKLMVDTFRGQIRVRKWPRKRGTPKSQAVRNQNQWFKEANEIAKRLEPTQMNLAIAMTKGTGMYPRDLLLRQQAGGIYEVSFEDGTAPQYRRYFRETVVFQGAILEKDATQAIPGGTSVVQTWPLPVLDTGGFWNAGAPTLLTIPAGITVVELTAAWLSVDPKTNIDTQINIRRNGIPIANDGARINGNQSNAAPTGPVTVVTGDTFDAVIFASQNTVVRGTQECRLTLNVLQAD